MSEPMSGREDASDVVNELKPPDESRSKERFAISDPLKEIRLSNLPTEDLSEKETAHAKHRST
ncbi:hypothetical protein [Hansschlegelia sp. KR7-227]|uniref:hypothetical protein n=1 Tax=Hansschlegelia sp. KR7-227 TaxID=3400914 RepID=UPI003C0651DF